MEKIVRAMMDLIASEVCGKELDRTQFQLSDEELAGLYRLSKFHDLAHLVGDALIKNDLIPEGELKAKFEKQLMMAVYRYERINYELTQIKQTLNDAQIPFLPLKGSVLRQYYPEPWMRTSCDIDVLVREEDLDRAVQVLTKQLAYRADVRGSHDVAFYSQSGIHVELHYSLIESKVVGEADKVLESVWEESTPSAEGSFCYVMPDALFYYYHIAHMAKHFQGGGCGIRPFLDIWVLNHRENETLGDRKALLEMGGLDAFSMASEKLSQVWFECAQGDDVTEQMERYLLGGGVYGTTENRVSVQQIKKGGKIRYALSRIWLPYDTLKFYYPRLNGKRILLPFFEVRRWFKLLFCGGIRRSTHELKVNSTISKETQNDKKKLLDSLHLK